MDFIESQQFVAVCYAVVYHHLHRCFFSQHGSIVFDDLSDVCILIIFLYGIGWLIYERNYSVAPMFVFFPIMTVLLIEKRWKVSISMGQIRIIIMSCNKK